jgi:hypothetical protein
LVLWCSAPADSWHLQQERFSTRRWHRTTIYDSVSTTYDVVSLYSLKVHTSWPNVSIDVVLSD